VGAVFFQGAGRPGPSKTPLEPVVHRKQDHLGSSVGCRADNKPPNRDDVCWSLVTFLYVTTQPTPSN
jgi:hypothetical protein